MVRIGYQNVVGHIGGVRKPMSLAGKVTDAVKPGAIKPANDEIQVPPEILYQPPRHEIDRRPQLEIYAPPRGDEYPLPQAPKSDEPERGVAIIGGDNEKPFGAVDFTV